MFVRVAALFACVLGVTSAAAEELAPEQARAFIAGKLFSYNCFDGTSGIGRIFEDGSIIGTVQPQGSTEVRFATLPPGTIRRATDDRLGLYSAPDMSRTPLVRPLRQDPIDVPRGVVRETTHTDAAV